MKLKRERIFIILVFVISILLSCASQKVISDQIKAEAERGVPFGILVRETGRYVGKTVILGGYIVGTRASEEASTLTVLQTPLARGEKPASKARSEGGFILSYKGYLDPEVYEKDRRVTVAGEVLGRLREGPGGCPQPCLKLDYRQIYLWPMYESPSHAPFYEDWVDPFDERRQF